jgi:hypothetical protein
VEVDIVSDAEFGKTGSWSRYVIDRLSGIAFRPRALASISSMARRIAADRRVMALDWPRG